VLRPQLEKGHAPHGEYKPEREDPASNEGTEQCVAVQLQRAFGVPFMQRRFNTRKREYADEDRHGVGDDLPRVAAHIGPGVVRQIENAHLKHCGAHLCPKWALRTDLGISQEFRIPTIRNTFSFYEILVKFQSNSF
jgi:hypothetical protein